MRNSQAGQSLIELLIALSVFVSAVAALAVFVLDSYASGRLAQEITAANFLAEEGLEAARSIRDNNWADLVLGDHGLKISDPGVWVFDGASENLSGQLGTGATRVISVERAGIGLKKVVSKIQWQFSEGRTEEISLTTYLTNWARSGPYLAQLHYRWRDDDGGE